MFTLYINTCSEKISVILFKKHSLFAIKEIEHQKSMSQFIMPTIKGVVGDNKLDNIVVVNGPGSFTGVRLGVVIAKTMAYLLDIPIKTITTLEELAVSLNNGDKTISLKEKNGYFVGSFDKQNNLIGEYKYFNNDEYKYFTKSNKITQIEEVDYIKVLKHALKKESTNPHLVNPIYVKKIGIGND